MYFRNEKHRQAFTAGVKKSDKKDKETLGAAKDIRYGTKYLTLGDLSDRSLIPARIYKLISQAMQISRCGVAALQ